MKLNLSNDQMELGLKQNKVCRSRQVREQRTKRAQWWFGQMRQAVAEAVDWKVQRPYVAVQMSFSTTH